VVSFISINMTLLPGNVILTGKPSGVGPIDSGDRLHVRIQGLAPAGEHGEVTLSRTPET